MKKIILSIIALICFEGTRAQCYLSPSDLYMTAITSPVSGSYIYLDPKGESVTINYKGSTPPFNFTATEFRTKFNNMINAEGAGSWLSLQSVTLASATRQGSITLNIGINNTGSTRGLSLKVGSTIVSYYQAFAVFTISPSFINVIPGEKTVSFSLDCSQSGIRYELHCNGSLHSNGKEYDPTVKVGTGTSMTFTAHHFSPGTFTIWSLNGGTQGSCKVKYYDAISKKQIIAPQKRIFVDQKGGNVTVNCTSPNGGGNTLGELKEIVNKMNGGNSLFWDRNYVYISIGSCDANHCNLTYNFAPNTEAHTIIRNSFFIFDADGTELVFEQEGINPIMHQRNWIRTKTFTSENNSQYIYDIVYHDGLGRLEQSIQKRAAPTGEDLITLQEYDACGRESALWIPTAMGHDGAWKEPQVIKNSATTSYTDIAPFTKTVYEHSPLGRIYETWNAGQVMQENNIKTICDYCSNDNGEVLTALVNNSGILEIVDRNTVAGILFKQITTDADDCINHTFTNIQGNTVLSRIISNGETFDTYYFYDLYDRLRWVMSPEGTRQMQFNTTYCEEDDLIKKYCYIYRYDSRNRICEKQLPGKEVEYFVYDRNDCIVASQDGNMREINKWVIYNYDRLSRLLWEGSVTNTMTRAQMVDYLNMQSSLGGLKSDPSFTLNKQSWYDIKPTTADNGLIFSQPDISWDQSDYRTHGLKTYERVAVLGAVIGSYVDRAFYYDYKGRIIQIVERNHLGGVSRYSTKYDFTDNVLISLEQHQSSATSNTYRHKRIFSYDQRDRMLSEALLDSLGSAHAIVRYAYDNLGHPKVITYGSGPNAIADTLSYNIQGWLTNKTNSKFDMKLRYYNPMQQSTTPSYSGNITEWEWKHKEDPQSPASTYAFTYDKLSRLINSDQYIGNTLNNQFVEQGLKYDNNGNILTLKRYDAGTLSDDYSYSYNGNKLTALNQTMHYEYDANGNMTHDGHHNLDLEYNYLNLLSKVSANGTTKANYTYLSDGTKVGVVGANGNGFDYMGSLVYSRAGENVTLEGAAFSSGRIVASNSASGTTYETNYFLTDHLGSIRVVVDADGQVKERSDYYPYGKKHPNPDLMASVNRYGFNGKELQTTSEINYMDFGARMYNQELGRFFKQDRFLEKYPSISPYQYAANNPIKNIDINGDSLQIMNRHSLLAIYHGLEKGSNIEFQIKNGMIDPASFTNQAQASNDTFIKDLYAVSANKNTVELSTSLYNIYMTADGNIESTAFERVVDDNTSNYGVQYESQLREWGDPLGKHIVGNLGQTLLPGNASISGKQSLNNNVQVIINGNSSLNHQTVGIAHELGHIILHFNSKPHGHGQPGVDNFIYEQRVNVMLKRLGYDF